MKAKVVLGNLIKVCPCKRSAWFESNIGKIKKPVKVTGHGDDQKVELR